MKRHRIKISGMPKVSKGAVSISKKFVIIPAEKSRSAELEGFRKRGMYKMSSNTTKRIINTEKYCSDSPVKTKKQAIIEIANPTAITAFRFRCMPEKQKLKAVSSKNIEIYLI